MLMNPPRCFDGVAGVFRSGSTLSGLGEDELRREVLGVVGVAVTRSLVKEAMGLLRACAARTGFDLLLCDALGLWSSLLDPQRQKDEWRALAALVGETRAERLCSEESLRTHLDLSAVVESRLSARGETAEVLSRRLTRVRTVLVFKQQKYNLMREETEGYSR